MEVVLSNPEMEHTISSGAGHERLVRLARSSGARSLWESGVSQMLVGETSPDELLRVLEPDGAALEMHFEADSPLPPPSFDDIQPTKSTYDTLDKILHGFDRMTKVVPGVVDVYVINIANGVTRVLVLQRAHNTRCPGAWETVHGNLNETERPEDGAVRELREETGLTPDRLYNVTVQPFYLHTMGTVQLAIVFAAFVSAAEISLGEEHQQYEWVSPAEAAQRFAWPREREALTQILQLIPGGDAGPVDDVLRVPLKS